MSDWKHGWCTTNTVASVGLSMLGGLLASGCGGGPRMTAPPEFAEGSRTLEVQERSRASGALANESFKIGDWQISDVDRDWNSSGGFSVAGYGSDKKKTGYGYRLKASQTWEGACASLREEKGVGNVSWGNSNLACECTAGSTKVQAVLTGNDKKRLDGGEGTLGDQTLRLSLVEETEGMNLTGAAAGYRLDRGEEPVAAVETLYPGRVWLTEGVDGSEAEAVSCLFAGLMLYVPPSD